MVAAPLTTSAPVAAPVHPWVSALLGALPAPAGFRPETTLAARAALAAAGLPSRRQEDWRFTETAPIAAVAPQLLAPEALPALPPVAEGHHRVVLDGKPENLATIAWPAGIEVLSAEETRDALGCCLDPEGKAPDWPVLLQGACDAPVLALRVRGAVSEVLEL